MFKRLTFITLAIASAFTMQAQSTLRSAWLSQPDSLFPYLDKGKRAEMLDYFDMNINEKVKNSLEGGSKIVVLTNDYLNAEINESCNLGMKLFVSQAGDTAICVVKTLEASMKESQIYITTPDWKKLRHINTPQDLKLFVSDSIPPDTLQKLQEIIVPLTIETRLSADDDIVVQQISFPILSKEERVWAERFLLQRKFKLISLIQ